MTDAEEWLPISAAAARLGISDRQARRHAAKLGQSDRRTSDASRTLVRLSALAEAAKRKPASDNSVGRLSAITSDAVTDTPPDTSDTATDASAQRVREMQAQIEGLKQDKDRLLSLLDKALTTIGSQEQRVKQLEQLEATLIQALPMPPKLPMPLRSSDVPPVPDGPQAAPGDVQEAPREAETLAQGQEEERTWWERLWKGRS